MSREPVAKSYAPVAGPILAHRSLLIAQSLRLGLTVALAMHELADEL
jgi:hypothetical protein